jgi:hypothetical protein
MNPRFNFKLSTVVEGPNGGILEHQCGRLWPEGKTSTFAKFLEWFFRQLELNDLFLVIRLSFGSSGAGYSFVASFTSKFLLPWASFSWESNRFDFL